jgi:predicted transcriptional regulator
MVPIVEPLSRSLARTEAEDEEITAETAAAIDRARASFARGEHVSHEDILREFGLR